MKFDAIDNRDKTVTIQMNHWYFIRTVMETDLNDNCITFYERNGWYSDISIITKDDELKRVIKELELEIMKNNDLISIIEGLRKQILEPPKSKSWWQKIFK